MSLIHTVGIVGSAGRGPDQAKFTSDRYNLVLDLLSAYVEKERIENGEVHLVSGGAAFMDHVAVILFLRNSEKYSLTLFIPSSWDRTTKSFDCSNDCGFVSNMYHEKFSRVIGRDSLLDIDDAISKGATIKVGRDFFDRNTSIAEASDALYAGTFGHGPLLADGGTADTMRKYLRNKSQAYHLDLHTLDMYKNVRTLP